MNAIRAATPLRMSICFIPVRKCSLLHPSLHACCMHVCGVCARARACVRMCTCMCVRACTSFHPGICTGPKREFLSALSREIAADRHALFIQCDDHHYMLVLLLLLYCFLFLFFNFFTMENNKGNKGLFAATCTFKKFHALAIIRQQALIVLVVLCITLCLRGVEHCQHTGCILRCTFFTMF